MFKKIIHVKNTVSKVGSIGILQFLFLTVLTLLVGIVVDTDSVQAEVVSQTQIGDTLCYWSIGDNNTLYITGKGNPSVSINTEYGDNIPWDDYNNLIKAVEISSTVRPTSMKNWFAGCIYLEKAPTIPNSVKDCTGTFWHCFSLRTPPEIPYGVTNCFGMFDGCYSLETAPTIPDSATFCYEMFVNCRSLTAAPKIPQSANCYGMFRGCRNLITAPEIPNSIADCTEMFEGCSTLVTAPEIPESVTRCSKMFEGCSSLVTAPEIPESVEYCYSMFKDCTSLTGVVKIKSSGVDNEMFSGTIKPIKIKYAGKCTKEIAKYYLVTESSNSNVTLANYCVAISPIADVSLNIGETSPVITPNLTGNDYDSLSVKLRDNDIVTVSDKVGSYTFTGVKSGNTLATFTAENYNGTKVVSTFIISVSEIKPEPEPEPVIDDSEGPDSESPAEEKQKQSITAKNITKVYGSKPFNICARAKTKLSYSSSNKKIVTVNKAGKVTIKGCGITKVTIKAVESDKYKAAKKVVTVTVKPKKVSIGTVKSSKKKMVVVKWKRDKKASGYDIQYKTGKKSKTVSVYSGKKTSYTLKKLKGGVKYQIRVRAYVNNSGKKINGSWSKYKTVKVKK